jgi:hypothetical protein
MLGRHPTCAALPSANPCAVSPGTWLRVNYLALMLGRATGLRAQTFNRYEGIPIDVSGSIGPGGANNELFKDYAHGVRQLLLTEPLAAGLWCPQ